MTEPKEQKEPFKITWAKPDSPIYSRGWTVGSVSPSRRYTESSQTEDSDKPAPSSRGKELEDDRS